MRHSCVDDFKAEGTSRDFHRKTLLTQSTAVSSGPHKSDCDNTESDRLDRCMTQRDLSGKSTVYPLPGKFPARADQSDHLVASTFA
jgi:hypothetical protein